MSDFRSDPSSSRDGQGSAKRAWEAYSRAVNKVANPVVKPIVESWSVGKVADLLGFWLMWQLEGGFDGLRRHGMSERTIYRKTSEFRKIFKVHPDDFSLSGVAVDVRAYLSAQAETSEDD